MDSFVNFLNENKVLLISIVTLILSVILIFIKKRPKTIDEFISIIDEIIGLLPGFINKVEIPNNGLMKKKEVLSMCFNLVKKKLGRELSNSELDYAYKKFDDSIEAILSTPQKRIKKDL